MSNKLLVTKTIYPGSKVKSADQIEEILWLEVETHLRNNPELGFVKSTGPVKNSDLTHTYKLEFTPQETAGGAQGIDAKPVQP